MDSGHHVGYAHQPARSQPIRLTDNSNVRISACSNPSIHHKCFIAIIDPLYTRQLVARLGI